MNKLQCTESVANEHPEILKAFLQTIPTKIKPTKCPVREKKSEARKAKKEGRRESENFAFCACPNFAS